MIYQLTAPARLALPESPFAALPSAGFGMMLWLVFCAGAIAYALRLYQSGKPGWPAAPMLLATGIYVGLFINMYELVDEVMINLEHSYNLMHFGKFSMSSARWVDGTVEMLYYLVHSPFAWSQTSLVMANFAISFAVGWLHLPLVARLFPKDSTPLGRTFALCGFALFSPLLVIFSSGFGNGLVSLAFLAAIVASAEERTATSLTLSGLLPLIRPDAALVSVANIGVLALRRSIQRKHLALLLVPVASMAIYYTCYRYLYGHWVPTPVRFKTLTPAMLAMTNWREMLFNLLLYVAHPAHIAGVTALFLCSKEWFGRLKAGGAAAEKAAGMAGAGSRVAQFLTPYALATLPLLLFYNFTRATLGDFSFHTYARYWVPFEVTLAALTVAHFGLSAAAPAAHLRELGRIATLLVAGALISGGFSIGEDKGREDSAFAGSFTQRFLPADLTLATTEMNTFGFMIDRPIVDLWGYTTPEITSSPYCNADRIRNNPAFFLSKSPDVYWPYWFTHSLSYADDRGGFETAELSFAKYPHTSREGNLLGNMRQVLRKYDVVLIEFPRRPKLNQIGYLVRREALPKVLAALAERGIVKTRERPTDWNGFERVYNQVALKTYPCN